MFPFEIDALARLLIDEARTRGVRIVTAESCTGGLLSAAITAIPGSSDVFDRAFITYSNRANGGIHHRMELFDEEDRDGVRLGAVRAALEMLRERVEH